ncbi:MAG: hypothetical protein KBB33_04285 [Candidatus Cloacimonetes bacterium]|mgnify:CR=1 FL=1|nr:hypothetical protein [Candidatus Cloacimonadota bacterium]HPI26247.1 hypothetical protein [Candidatus Cloacimonadota bacterium]
MNNEIITPLAKELANRINNAVNIPFVSEEQEQYFFEMIIVLVLDTLLGQISKELINKAQM